MATFTSNPQTFPIDVQDTSTTQEMNLGSNVVTPDGRAYRYAKAGAVALVAGSLQTAPGNIADHTDKVASAVVAIGAQEITITLGGTLVTANQYAEGVIVITNNVGEGHAYTIKSHPAAIASANLTVTLDDNESVLVALTTASTCTLVSNQYNGTLVYNGTSIGGAPIGLAPIDVVALSFYWMQTRGVGSMLNEAGTAVGLDISASNAVATGAGQTATAGVPSIAVSVQGVASGQHGAVLLKIE